MRQLLPLDRMLVHYRAIPSIKFSDTHLYTWVERGTVKVKCLAQEHNTMSTARAQTRTALSEDERTNYEAKVLIILRAITFRFIYFILLT